MAINDTQKSSNPLVRLISFVWGAIKIYFFMTGVFVTLLTFGLISLFFTLADSVEMRAKPVSMKDEQKYVLRLVLDGELRESSPDAEEVFLSGLFRQNMGVDLLEVQNTLRSAGEDERIAGLFVEIRNVSGSLSAFTELRSHLQKFRETKKPIHAWLAAADTSTYYMASVADHLSVAPAGDIALLGPVVSLTYFADGLKKLGVNMQVIRSGKFKAAFEPFVLNEPSPETLLMYRELERSLRTHLAETIAKSRSGTDRTTIEGWMRKSLFTIEEAKSANIVDAALPLSEAEDKAKGEKAGEAEFITFARYRASITPRFAMPKTQADEGIALLEAVGDIELYPDSSRRDEVIAPVLFGKWTKWAQENQQVKAVVIRISSPGGSAIASDIMWQQINELAKVKPVVISMGAYAASGGYYMASAGSKIVAEPTTITGSIGVIAMVPEFSGFRDKYGISFYTITNSERVALLNPGTPVSEADRALLINGIDTFYQTFLNRVAAGRKMKVEDVDKVAQGRVWTGQQAVEIGLVDSLGGLTEAIREAKVLANLDVEKRYPILRYAPEDHNLLDCLMGPANFEACMETGADVVSRSTSGLVRKFGYGKFQLEKLERFLLKTRKEPMQAYWPGALHP